MSICVLGGSGFLGRCLARKLKENYEVILGSRNNGLNKSAELETNCINSKKPNNVCDNYECIFDTSLNLILILKRILQVGTGIITGVCFV